MKKLKLSISTLGLTSILLGLNPTHSQADDLFDGLDFIKKSIRFCNKMRSEKNSDLIMPKEFHPELLEMVKRVKENPRIPGELATLLEKDAQKLMTSNTLTLYQWNVFHYRVSNLYNRLHPNLDERYYDLDDKDLPANTTQEQMLELIQKDHEQHDKKIMRVGDSFQETLQPNLDSGYCPVAQTGSIGVGAMNFAFAERVGPIGILDNFEIVSYDGIRGLPNGFFWHDTVHARNFLESNMKEAGISTRSVRPIKTKIPEDIYNKAKEKEVAFLNQLNVLSLEEQRKIHIIHFFLKHEKNRSNEEITKLCQSNAGQVATQYEYRRCTKVSDFNLGLPVELQGSWDAIKNYVINPGKSNLGDFYTTTGPFGPHDDVSTTKGKQIKNYLISSGELYCTHWLSYVKNGNKALPKEESGPSLQLR